jgi:hypothetical protein
LCYPWLVGGKFGWLVAVVLGVALGRGNCKVEEGGSMVGMGSMGWVGMDLVGMVVVLGNCRSLGWCVGW